MPAKKKTAKKKAPVKNGNHNEPTVLHRLQGVHASIDVQDEHLQGMLGNLMSLVNTMLTSSGLSAVGTSSWNAVTESNVATLVGVVEGLEAELPTLFSNMDTELDALHTALDQLSNHVFGGKK
jgi:hypothetical protein